MTEEQRDLTLLVFDACNINNLPATTTTNKRATGQIYASEEDIS